MLVGAWSVAAAFKRKSLVFLATSTTSGCASWRHRGAARPCRHCASDLHNERYSILRAEIVRLWHQYFEFMVNIDSLCIESVCHLATIHYCNAAQSRILHAYPIGIAYMLPRDEDDYTAFFQLIYSRLYLVEVLAWMLKRYTVQVEAVACCICHPFITFNVAILQFLISLFSWFISFQNFYSNASPAIGFFLKKKKSFRGSHCRVKMWASNRFRQLPAIAPARVALWRCNNLYWILRPSIFTSQLSECLLYSKLIRNNGA